MEKPKNKENMTEILSGSQNYALKDLRLLQTCVLKKLI